MRWNISEYGRKNKFLNPILASAKEDNHGLKSAFLFSKELKNENDEHCNYEELHPHLLFIFFNKHFLRSGEGYHQ